MRRLLIALTLIAASATAHAATFSNWAAVVVAGDYHDHDGGDSEVFDNGRRDIAAALTRIGFNPVNIEQFSVRPARHGSGILKSDLSVISSDLWDLSQRAPGGCIAYITSHRSPDGVLIGDKLASPRELGDLMDNACGGGPTIVIVSACFSGVFVPVLAGPNRLVFTAARPDRTSFGCGQADRYTFFDQCFLGSLPGSHDFPGLADRVKACVTAREKQEKMTPPSEPQFYIGPTIAAELPRW